MNGKTLAPGLALTLILAFAAAAPAVASDAQHELRACWLTHYYYTKKTDDELRATAKDMKSHGVNTVYIAVYAGLKPQWPSRAFKLAGGEPESTDWVAKLLPIFRAEGLKVGAWFEYGMMLGWKDHPIALAHPNWLQRDAAGDPVSNENPSAERGGGMVFLSPGSQPAVKLMEDMLAELAANYDFDDIQLDRFRWTRKSAEGREFGYESDTAEAFRKKTGRVPPEDKNDTEWVVFREELVNQAVERCYRRIKAIRPEVVVSVAPVGYYGVAQSMQRWGPWLEGGYIDLVIPQIYITPADLEADAGVFAKELGKHLRLAGAHRSQVACGLRAMEANDAASVERQIRQARERGVFGACLWVYHEYKEKLPAIRDELDLFTQPGHVWEKPARNPYVFEEDYFYLARYPLNEETKQGVAVSRATDGHQGAITREGLRYRVKLSPATPFPAVLKIQKQGGAILVLPLTAEMRQPDGSYVAEGKSDLFLGQKPAGEWTVSLTGADRANPPATIESWTLAAPLAPPAAPSFARTRLVGSETEYASGPVSGETSYAAAPAPAATETVYQAPAKSPAP